MLEKTTLIYFLPLLASALILFLKSERIITRVSLIVNLIVFAHTLFLVGYFILFNQSFYEFHLGNLAFKKEHFELDFLFDGLTLLFSSLVGLLSLVVIKFSAHYLHRETGFKRFFFIINLFIFGLYLLSIAGTLDLFFAGWEVVGLSSFLLIGFYHERTRPIRNAFRVFSIYRFCDIGLLFSAILIHHYFKGSHHFYALAQSDITPSATWVKELLPFLIILSSIGKSAQFPFINWPARAMEGPTPSSAIFYGGLSIHCGVFLLLRTYPLFQGNSIVLGLIFGIGLLSFIYASKIGKVQSNIKGQLSYSAVSQIGLMFIEISLGLISLVYVHLFFHAILRCYQILVSPSIVADHIFNKNANPHTASSKMSLKLATTLYSFGIQEGFISITERGFFPLPLITLKKYFMLSVGFLMALPVFTFCLYYFSSIFDRGTLFESHVFLAHVLGSIDLAICLYCLTSYANPQKIWNIFFLSILTFICSNLVLSSEAYSGVLLYAIGAIPCWILGFVALRRVPKASLNRYNGLFSLNKNEYYLFLLAFIGLSGYPFTTIFWAEDVLLAELLADAPILLLFTGVSMVLNGFIGARLLVKVFWGFPSVTEV